jgi:hypothetical protein
VALEQAAVKKAAEKGGAAAPAVVEGAAAVEYEVMSLIAALFRSLIKDNILFCRASFESID